MDARFELGPGQVDVWRLDLSACQDARLLERYRGLLGPEERARLERFAFEHLRLNYLASHALTRILLARYEGATPAALTFTVNAFGRPELHESRRELRFNLSHAKGLAALAVTRRWDIGVDVECETRRVAPLQIAERYFAPAEVEWLRRQPAQDQMSGFVDLWSLKEAYIKARGLGLSMALDQFTVDLSGPGHPRVAHQTGFEDAAADWMLYLLRPAAGCALSVAIRCGAGVEPDLATFEVASPADFIPAQ